MEHTIQKTAEEIAEIERHKYFLSEKAGYDVGWEHAEQDWVSNHAKKPTDSASSNGGLGLLFKRLFSRKEN